MEKKGEIDSVLLWEAAYAIFFIVFFAGMFFYAGSYRNQAFLVEDFYLKEISYIVDSSERGTEVYLDVNTATRIAAKSGKEFNEIFNFDNVNKKVIVSLQLGRASSFDFFNNVTVKDWRVETLSGGAETNRLYFKIE